MNGLLTNIGYAVKMIFGGEIPADAIELGSPAIVYEGVFDGIVSMAEANSFVAIALMTLLVGFGVGLITRFISMVRG